MRLSFIMLLVSSLSVIGSSYSQSTKFSFQLSNTTVKAVFQEIERSSEFIIVYSDDMIDVSREVSVKVSDANIEKILDQILKVTNNGYEIKDRQIVITKPKSTSLEEMVVQTGFVLKGVVKTADGNSLPGATVMEKGTNNGTITDFEGGFTLNVSKKNAVIVFSFIGMSTMEVDYDGQPAMNVVMREDAIGLEEVVAIGYGTQTKREISGSVTNISEKNFNKGVTRTGVDLLKGKVAGLTITSGSGDVTKDQTIRLRGTSSLNASSQPFIVVDGVPGMSLNSVAPQDIESISVLKDASAAAIYGSRSASGVILITTKKGQRNQTTTEYDGYVAVDNVTNVPELLNAQEWRDYATKNNINTAGLDKGGNTDWFDEIMRTGITQNHSVSLSGSTKSSNYRASISYLNQEGVVKDNVLERYNARMSFNQKALNDKLDLTFTGVMTQRNYSPTDTRNFVLAYNMIPVYPVKNSDGTWYDNQEYDQGNPVRNIEYNNQENKNSLYFGNIKADLDIFEGLKASLNMLKQRESNDYSQYYDSQTERGRNDIGYAQRNSWTADKKLLETTLNYKKVIENHNMNFLAGYSYEDNYYQNMGAQNRQFVTDLFGANNLSAGENLRSGDVWSGKNMNKLISFFGRVNYTLLEKYVLTASIRRDGSSKFGKNHQWGTFPSVSAAWHMKEESFLKNVDALDDLKFRLGYGVSGNQDGLDPYLSLPLYGKAGQYYDNGKWYSAYEFSQNENPDLRWEQTSMFNVGFDYSFFNGRINGSIDYYNKNTDDLLYTYSVPQPPYLKGTMMANVGSMNNKGVEFMVSGDIVRKDDFRWNTTFNIAHNKNEITSLSNDQFTTSAIKTGSAWIRGGSNNTTHIVEEGKELGTFYGWLCTGIDSDGKYIMDDMIDGKAGLTDEDRTYIGSAQPDFTYGLANVISYKNWEMNFFFRGVYGNDVLNFSKMSYATTQWLPGANVLKESLTIGLKESPRYNSYYIEDGSFLRLDNASVAYNFDTKGFYGIKKLRVYVTGQNLFVITKYTGLDPEIEMSGLDPGVEGREYYPKSRTFSVGVNLSF
ncbi:MAG TPA: SusC/RagA family TonB-linked outer membrane protein [Prolixibacteraceae bacterium]|nr:SusC/RagA family TonB-linked outer membrane protein [Prolixibacteraceae bacterium]